MLLMPNDAETDSAKKGDPKGTGNAGESGAAPTGNESSTPNKIEDPPELLEWKKSRSAIIHTLDISAKHSLHAQKVIRSFRRGVYYGHIDFHTGEVQEFLSRPEIAAKPKQFLNHVVLDMPAANKCIAEVAYRLKVNGTLLVFNPSVTQIVECLMTIRELKMPLRLESVVELAAGSAGGREWDVRVARIRKPRNAPGTTGDGAAAENKGMMLRMYEWFGQWALGVNPISNGVDEPKSEGLVCRPKAGDRVSVGGFVGIWRRVKENEMEEAS